MRYTSMTIEREVVGPFTGKRFPSMSDDAVDALLTIEYQFEGFTITIANIPARWDRTSGAEYVTSKVGRAVNERVTTLAAVMERQQRPRERMYQREGRLNRAQMIADVLQTTPLRLSLNLPRTAYTDVPDVGTIPPSAL